MRLLVFSDIHNDAKALERLLAVEADYYFAAGDLVTWAKGFDRMGGMLAQRAGRVYVIPGNHESESDIARLCEQHGLHNFHGRSLQTGGFQVAGLGYSNITPFHTPGEYGEPEMASRLEPFAALHPLILVCHCPPKGTPLDRAGEGQHFGSQAVREFIDRVQPEYFFCGHIHEAEGTQTQIGKTKCVNVGKRGFLLEIE
ncbi:MAG: metallophosphoesterase [Acidobacteria bacterium]|nr:metallophosphoesterase [Acidobacteriota bacterium]